jgi:hypothetical protein
MEIKYKERIYHIYIGVGVSGGLEQNARISGYMTNHCTKLFYSYVLKEDGNRRLGQILVFKEKQENIKLIDWEDYRPYVIYLSEDFSPILNSSNFPGSPILVHHYTPELKNEGYNFLMEIVKQITQAYA